MSVQDLQSNPETGAEPEEIFIRRMVRAIDYAEGFWLGFAKSNTPAQRRRLSALCRDLLEPLKIRVIEIELNEPITDLLPVLRERLAQEQTGREEEHEQSTQPKLTFFVHGLEHSIPSREAYPPLLSSLNLNRELFRRQLPHPLLLWLPDYALTALARKAPDFWAWRSGLYEFAPERETAEQTLEVVSSQAVYITENLSEKAKRERLVMLKGLLEDYRELGSGLREQLAQIHILNDIGITYGILEDFVAAKAAFEEALTVSRMLKDADNEAAALHNLGRVSQEWGEIEEARRLFYESLEIEKKLGDLRGMAITLHQLGRLAEVKGDVTEAARLFRESLNILDKLGTPSAEIARRSLARVEGGEQVSE